MIAKRKKTFSINNNPEVNVQIKSQQKQFKDMQIKYFTDSVYHSLVYSIPFNIETTDNQKQTINTQSQITVKMNFSFLFDETKKHKKIFDNIGVLNIRFNNQLVRYGILVTQQKGQIFISLIQ